MHPKPEISINSVLTAADQLAGNVVHLLLAITKLESAKGNPELGRGQRQAEVNHYWRIVRNATHQYQKNASRYRLHETQRAEAKEQAITQPNESDPAVAAIAFTLELEETGHPGEGVDFLRLWNEGEFDVCRREWPDAPNEVYVGADQLFTADKKGTP